MAVFGEPGQVAIHPPVAPRLGWKDSARCFSGAKPARRSNAVHIGHRAESLVRIGPCWAPSRLSC
jgi:hypothetical protein